MIPVKVHKKQRTGDHGSSSGMGGGGGGEASNQVGGEGSKLL